MKKIALHSVPRSGSSWLGQIINSHPAVIYKFQPLFSYAFKDFLTEKSTKEDIELFFQKIALKADPFLDQTEKIKSNLSPDFKKNKERTHIVYKEVRYHHILENLLEKDKEVKFVGLIRNPKAVIHSWLNAPSEFRKDLDWEELEEWENAEKKNQDCPEEFNGFVKWKEVALLFQKLKNNYPNRVVIVEYNDLVKSPETVTKDLFHFLGLNFNPQTEDFLNQNISKKDPYSVFKNKKDDSGYINNLNPIIVNEIEKQLKNSSLEKYLKP